MNFWHYHCYIKSEKVEIMKNLIKVTGVLIVMFMLSSCVVHDNGHRVKTVPPGQAKKVFGGSAKDYAPGQVKKRSGN